MELTRGEAYDQGLRNFMTGIFNWMILGILLSAGAAWVAMAEGLPQWFALHSGYFLIALFAPLGIILWMGAMLKNGSLNAMRLGYLFIAFLEGLTISTLVARYSPDSAILAFVATAASFAGLSLWGYTTNRNLSGIGNFLIMALFGLIAALILQMFLQSSMLDMIITAAGVLIFAGLTAYDTQTLKNSYSPGMSSDELARLQVWGALDLYLDFLNLFIYILRIVGSSSSSNSK